MSQKLSVTFAYPYTDAAGKNHNADATASLPLEEARELIAAGRARVPADKAASSATAKKEQ